MAEVIRQIPHCDGPPADTRKREKWATAEETKIIEEILEAAGLEPLE